MMSRFTNALRLVAIGVLSGISSVSAADLSHPPDTLARFMVPMCMITAHANQGPADSRLGTTHSSRVTRFGLGEQDWKLLSASCDGLSATLAQLAESASVLSQKCVD
jgi:hypothetical protein